MFDRFSRSWALVKASGAVLMQDKTLLLFPLISGISVVMVVLCFALPLVGVRALDGLTQGGFGITRGVHYLVAFLFYLTQYFVIFFCNAALVGAAMMQLDGKTPTLGDGFRIASSKAYAILGYAAVAATVGLILRMIQRRVGFIGRIVAGILGTGWTLATYLVVPVLVARDVGPLDAISESAALFKKTWGENVIGQSGLGIAFFFVYFAVVACGAVLLFLASATHSLLLVSLIVLIAICAFIVTALVHSALSGIYAAALYRYVTDGKTTQGFDTSAMQVAFRPAG
jgi:hypothetical protein